MNYNNHQVSENIYNYPQFSDIKNNQNNQIETDNKNDLKESLLPKYEYQHSQFNYVNTKNDDFGNNKINNLNESKQNQNLVNSQNIQEPMKKEIIATNYVVQNQNCSFSTKPYDQNNNVNINSNHQGNVYNNIKPNINTYPPQQGNNLIYNNSNNIVDSKTFNNPQINQGNFNNYPQNINNQFRQPVFNGNMNSNYGAQQGNYNSAPYNNNITISPSEQSKVPINYNNPSFNYNISKQPQQEQIGNNYQSNQPQNNNVISYSFNNKVSTVPVSSNNSSSQISNQPVNNNLVTKQIPQVVKPYLTIK